MNIQIDTSRKTIKIEECINLKEFLDEIKCMLPSGEWKEYSIEITNNLNYTYYPYINPPFSVTAFSDSVTTSTHK